MINDSDLSSLSRGKVFVSTRPRGILSGFLVLVPSVGAAVYIPPLAAKIGPRLIRLRVSDSVWNSGGAIFSAYMTRDKQLVLEDIIVWKDTVVWATMTFQKRWNDLMTQFVTKDYIPDVKLQDGITVQLANYMSFASLCSMNADDVSGVVEFVFDAPNHKRLIWIPDKADAQERPAGPTAKHTNVIRRESNLGPDVYSVWDTDRKKRLGVALIRTLAMSKQLRMCGKEELEAYTEWNPSFEKWEITGIL